jgi:hypothetical protein
MSNYKCDKCNKKFTRKTAYASHLMRVSSCIKDTNINNECSYCSKLYSNKHNLKVHMNTCKEKPIVDEVTQSQIEELKNMFERKFEEQQKKFEEQLKKIQDQQSHSTETNNNNININENSHNTTNNTTNNINIYSIGKEDLSLLSKEDILKLCTSGTYYPIVAAEILHCNDKYPEYQNVLISNLRATTGQVKVNDKWITRSQDDILNTMMNTDKKHISSLIKDLEVDKKLHIKLESTQDEIDTNQVKEHQKSKIKQRLYDASDMIKKNKASSPTVKCQI